MKDVILWTAVFGPFVLGFAILGFEMWRSYRAPAEFHEHCAMVDDELVREAYIDRDLGRWGDYNSRHGQTLPCATSTQREWARVLRPSSAPDQSGDSRRRGDC
jgi:hypothetical protein